VGLLGRALVALGIRSGEGQFREGPYWLPETGAWLSADAGRFMNWWQLGHNPTGGRGTAMVEACVSAYAQTVAMCPGNQWRWTQDGGRERVRNTALVRVLRQPNSYQTISDFLLNLIRSLLLEGNAYALAVRNDRYEIAELHLFNPYSSGYRMSAAGDVFYQLAGNDVIERQIGSDIVAPARDVLHLRLHTPRHPLRGESPLVAAALQMAAGNAALEQQINFFINQSRPSFVLSTDQILTPEQVLQLRERWNEHSQGLNQGKTPILTAGLKPQPIGSSAKDTQLVEFLKLSDEAVAQVFRTPLQVLGLGSNPYNSTETLMQSWKAGGLGFLLNHIEEAMGLLFKLGGQPDEYLEFDTSALLRSDFKARVEAWVAGTKGGIFDRNTARADFELAPVEFGDEPWVQQQDIPLSVAGETANNPPPPPALPAPPEPEGAQDEQRSLHLSSIERKAAELAAAG
jgi:HK97 family phage portal protein